MTQAELWEAIFQALHTEQIEDRQFLRAHATLTEPLVLREGTTLAAGTRVAVVMASRFGDVGITDDLDAEHGYSRRIQCVPGFGFTEGNEIKELLTDIEMLPAS